MRKVRKLSEEHKRKLSEVHKGRLLSKNHKRKISEALKGEKNPFYNKHHSEKTKKKISDAGRKRHHSEETKLKLSEICKGEKHHFYGKHLTEEHKKKISDAFKGEKHPNWKGGKVKIICKICGKEKNVRPSHIKKGWGKFCSQKCAAIDRNKHLKKYDTSIERAIEQELKKQNIPYMKQVPLEGIALVDFLLPNKIIIQCDGNYWHSRKINKGKDIAQDTVLHFKSYKVFRFTETEIKKSPFKCIKKVISYIS